MDEGFREGYRHLLLDFRESHLLSVTRSISVSNGGWAEQTEPFVSLKRLRLKMHVVLEEVKLLIRCFLIYSCE